MLRDSETAGGRLFTPPEAEEPGVERTLNGTGYMISTLDEISEAFVEFAGRQAPWPVLDVGAAFGVATLAALKAGVRVVANDIDVRHLAVLKDRTPPELTSKLTVVPGAFPGEIAFAAETFSAVLASRVMHFFDGAQVESAARRMHEWLTPGGKAFVVVESSIFLDHPPLRDRYTTQRAAGARWPGFVKNVKELLPRRAKFVPDQLHYLDTQVLSRTFREAGFVVEQARPFHRRLDSQSTVAGTRESIGLIARKP